MDVAGKKAIVFGGTSGIGLATAKQLAALGAEVIAISRNPEKAGDVPDGITLMQCDVRDREAMAKLFQDCAPFDILICSATGGTRSAGPFLEMVLPQLALRRFQKHYFGVFSHLGSSLSRSSGQMLRK